MALQAWRFFCCAATVHRPSWAVWLCSLAASWTGWQVRRPLLEGDPRQLLAAFEAGQPHWMVSTALETGIGRRWVNHLAALQALGPSPTAPGLAPGWYPQGDLLSPDPQLVWQAAA